MANRIRLAVVIEHLHNLMLIIADLDTAQHLVDHVRAEIAANGATYADAVAQLAQDRRRLAEALLVAAARRAPPEPEEQHPAALPESEPEPDEKVVAALDQLVADLAELADRHVRRELHQQQQQEVVVHLELGYGDPEVVARAVDYLQTAVHVERIQLQELSLVVAHAFVVMIRAAAFAVTRAHLLPGVLLTVVVAYALAYATSGGAVVPGSASLLRISALVLCFLFRGPGGG